MFIGHYGPGFVGKRLSPTLPLWVLFIAVELLDILWSIFVFLGIEKLRIVPGITAANPLDLYEMPYTHGLLGALGWSLLAAVLWRLFRRNEHALRESVVIGAGVFAHWVLDLLVHRPDLPLVGSLKVGFGLWNFPWPEFALETAVLVGGLFAYLGVPGLRRSSKRGAITLVAICLLIELVRVTLRPVPPSDRAVAAAGLVAYVLFALAAARFDRTPLRRLAANQAVPTTTN